MPVVCTTDAQDERSTSRVPNGHPVFDTWTGTRSLAGPKRRVSCDQETTGQWFPLEHHQWDQSSQSGLKIILRSNISETTTSITERTHQSPDRRLSRWLKKTKRTAEKRSDVHRGVRRSASGPPSSLRMEAASDEQFKRVRHPKKSSL